MYQYIQQAWQGKLAINSLTYTFNVIALNTSYEGACYVIPLLLATVKPPTVWIYCLLLFHKTQWGFLNKLAWYGIHHSRKLRSRYHRKCWKESRGCNNFLWAKLRRITNCSYAQKHTCMTIQSSFKSPLVLWRLVVSC